MTYFPKFYETDIKCHLCNRADCASRGKIQRNCPEFGYESGRCPKLPDKRGFVHKSERSNQRQAYPLVHAEEAGDTVKLNLSIPGDIHLKRIYQTKSGYWYYNTKDDDGNKIKRVVFIGIHNTRKSIAQYMERVHADYCIFDCSISDSLV